MLPFIRVFGVEFPVYTLMVILSFLSVFVYLLLKKRSPIKREDLIYSTLYAFLFLIFGGKLLYVVVSFLQLGLSPFTLTFNELMMLMKGGYVWYGAFFGGIFGYYVYSKQYQINYGILIEEVIPLFPLAHFFGRLGCFCAGCCYGIPFPEPVGLYFHENSFAPHNIPLLPVQLVEAGFNLFLFIFLITYSFTKDKKITRYSVYAFSYGVFRFFIEFLRYDKQRGFILFFSTSQWISILLIISAFFTFINYKRKV